MVTRLWNNQLHIIHMIEASFAVALAFSLAACRTSSAHDQRAAEPAGAEAAGRGGTVRGAKDASDVLQEAAIFGDASDSAQEFNDSTRDAEVRTEAPDSGLATTATDAGNARWSECSPCRAKNLNECQADLGCEAIPYWGESFAPCITDERGFGGCGAPCREAGIGANVCPSYTALEFTCPRTCDWGSYGLDKRGCRTCECEKAGDIASDFIAACAVEELCASDPNAERCVDGGNYFDAGVLVAGQTDGSHADAGVCATQSYWVLQPRTISTVIRVFDGNVALRMGTTERYQVSILLESECEMFATLKDLGYSGDATDFVDLAANAWVQVGSGCPTIYRSQANRLFTIEGRQQGNTWFVIRDHQSDGGTVPLYPLSRETSACQGQGCECGPSTPAGTAQEGESCITDCSCAQGLSCIGNLDDNGEQWKCLRTCNTQLDCPDGKRCVFDRRNGPSFICVSGDQCQIDDDCPAGFECTVGNSRNICRDKRNIFQPSRPCSCDAECLPGERCIDDGLGEAPVCRTICNRHTDCPPGNPINASYCSDKGLCALGP